MTAPEREALVKALRAGADDPMWAHHSEFPKRILAQAADMIEANAPAVTVTEENNAASVVTPSSTLGLGPLAASGAVPDGSIPSAAATSPRKSERDAVIAAVENMIDNSPIDYRDDPYISESAFREFNALVAAFRALKSTTPQTGSQE